MNTLVVFAREPVVGRAKTRLAAGVGVVHAHRLYRAMVARVLREVGHDPRWRTVIAVAPDRAVGHPDWRGFTQVGQGGGSLSPRLHRALNMGGNVCVIGTDCPEVRRQDVWEAFRRLRDCEVVLGPAYDGGFWLVGARGVGEAQFEGVRWSTEYALADVAERAGGEVGYLRTLVDVDDVAALREVRRRGGRI